MTSKISFAIFGIAIALLAAQFIPIDPPPKDDPGYFFCSVLLSVAGTVVGVAGLIQALATRKAWLLALLPIALNAAACTVFIKIFL